MTTRIIVVAAVAATLLLTGCSTPAPTGPSGGDEPTTAASPTNDAPLDYPFYFDEGVRDAVVGVQGQVAEWKTDFDGAACTAEEAIDENSKCPQLLGDGFRLANELKNQVFDVEESDFETSSGMANFQPVWESALAVSDSGRDWSGTCEYGPANDGCGDKAATLILDLTTYANAFADWKP
jgi:hypothetical protein